jgi:CheY-like chemotaxis protein
LEKASQPVRNLTVFRDSWDIDQDRFSRLGETLSADDIVALALVSGDEKLVQHSWSEAPYPVLNTGENVRSPALVQLINDAAGEVAMGAVDDLHDEVLIAFVGYTGQKDLYLVGLVPINLLVARLAEYRNIVIAGSGLRSGESEDRSLTAVEQVISFRIVEKRSGLPPILIYKSKIGADPSLGARTGNIDLGRRTWSLELWPSSATAWTALRPPAIIAAIVGLCFTALLTAYVRSLNQSRSRLQRSHSALQKAHEQLDEHHRHMLESEQEAAQICRELLQPMTALMLAHSSSGTYQQDKTELLDAAVGAVDHHVHRLLELLSPHNVKVQSDFRGRLDSLKVSDERVKRLPRRILLIEDDEGVRKFIQTCLTRMGFEVELAEDGEMGLALAQKKNYGLVLTDIMLPGKTGIEIFQETMKAKPNQRFLFMSGYAVRAEWLPIINRSVGFLEKPFDAAHLRAVLCRIYKFAHPDDVPAGNTGSYPVAETVREMAKK